MMHKISVIISFYNNIHYLSLVLSALEIQSFQDFEIIIADDGSNEAVTQKVENILNSLHFDSYHLWQEDKGFRKNKILNKAVSFAHSEYLIFIDGDCIPHPEFLKEHYINKSEKICLTGRRVNLSGKITSSLNEEKIKNHYFEKYFHLLIIDGIFGKSFDVEKGFYFKSQLLRKYFNKKKRGLLGCNFSIHKKNLIEINGFDERYEAPSIGEDSDVQFRLELNGINIKSLNNVAVQYHLYHKLQPRPQKNLDLFEKVKTEKSAFTKFGIKK